MLSTAEVVNRPVVDFEWAKSLSPLRAMTERHLAELLPGAKTETFFSDQTLFTVGDYDRQHLYLLHGEVELTDTRGVKQRITAGDTLQPIAHQQPRGYSARALTDCGILRIDSERLDQLLTWSQVAEYLLLDFSYRRDMDEDAAWIATVLRSNLFFKVPPTNAEAIFTRFTPLFVNAGEVIVRQGELGDKCYFIKEGKAEVVRSSDGVRAPEHVAYIGEGRCFGEDALVNETVRNATVIMRSNGVLMCLANSDFIRLLKEPEVEAVSGQQWLQNLQQPTTGETPTVVDVRTEEEYSLGHFDRAVNVPLNLLRIKSRQLDQRTPYLVYCDTGRRSRAVAHILEQQGFCVKVMAQGLAGFNPEELRTYASCTQDYVLRDGVAIKGQ